MRFDKVTVRHAHLIDLNSIGFLMIDTVIFDNIRKGDTLLWWYTLNVR